jgi:nucleoside-diphosphate-sugar epimerase/predicted dehydrogenase
MKIAPPTLLVGLLGTGYIAQWHARALGSIPSVSLAAVCDKDLARAQAFARRHCVPRSYESLEAMLGDRDLALSSVHVLLPPDLHASAAATLVQSGVHALLEKPMATGVDECDALFELATGRNAVIGVNHNFVFAPVYEMLRTDLKSGKLGRPDRVTVTWNRELDQLRLGPFDLWMLRDPRNIVLEIGPHCLAPMLDLVGPLEITGVKTSNQVTLPGGGRFYRRWSIEAGTGPVAVTIHLSFAPGFTEQTVHVRGSLASATVDFERNTYLLHRHTHHGLDLDRFEMIRREAGSLAAQARQTLRSCSLAKLGLATAGSPYGLGIARALESFYSNLGKSIDSRLSPELGRDIVKLCTTIGDAGAGQPITSAVERPCVPLADNASSQTPADILILGATGFIGQELARRLLSRGSRIRVLVREPGKLPKDLRGSAVEVVRGDLAREGDLARAMEGIRYVFHLARANVKSWDEFVEQDIEVTRRIAESCLRFRTARLIYTGTIDSYYAGSKAGTITEETPLDPQIGWRNLYARAKAASEEILTGLHVERGLPVVICRPGIVIGRGGSPFHWGIGMWSYNAVCRVWGRGQNPLPFVLVEDVAAALILAAAKEGIEGQSFNLIGEVQITALEYLKALEEETGCSFQKFTTSPWTFYATDLLKWVVKKLVRHPEQRRPSYRDWETRTQRARYDCTKAIKLLNWRPVCDRDEMIRKGIRLPASEFVF